MIICLVGMPGAGKSVTAKYLETKGYIRIPLGLFVKERVKKRGEKLTKETIEEASYEIHGMNKDWELAQKALELIKKKKMKNVVIDGVRDKDQWDHIADNADDDVTLVAIECPKHTRMERQLERMRFGDLTEDDIKRRDKREIMFGEKDLMDIADYEADNSKTIEHLKKELDNILKKTKK